MARKMPRPPEYTRDPVAVNLEGGSGPRSLDDHEERAGQDVDIEPGGPIANVLDVCLDALIEAGRVALGNLPDARDTRPNAQDDALLLAHFRDFALEVGARTDQAHLALQHVPDL